MCSECRPNVTTCPQCRDPLGNIRSLISEKMLEKLPCVCRYSEQGCQVSLKYEIVQSHVSVQINQNILKTNFNVTGGVCTRHYI